MENQGKNAASVVAARMYVHLGEEERQEKLRNATAAKMFSRNKTPKKRRNHFNINFFKGERARWKGEHECIKYNSNNKMCAFSQTQCDARVFPRFARLEIAISRLVQNLELLLSSLSSSSYSSPFATAYFQQFLCKKVKTFLMLLNGVLALSFLIILPQKEISIKL